MSEPDNQNKKRPLPQNLAGKRKSNALESEQFESMTDLSRQRQGATSGEKLDLSSQNQTFEIFQGEEVVASKRTKPPAEPALPVKSKDAAAPPTANTAAISAATPAVTLGPSHSGVPVPSSLPGAASDQPQTFATAAAQDPATVRAPSRAATSPPVDSTSPEQAAKERARYSLARQLESDCLQMITDLSHNIALMSELSESEKRRELLLSIRTMIKDRDVTGPVATTCAILAGYYRDSKEGDFAFEESQEPYGLYAADRLPFCRFKQSLPNALPDAFDEIAPDFHSGFAVSQNFLLPLYARLMDAAQKSKAQGVVQSIHDLIKVSRDGFTVTFPGALAPLKVEPLSEGEMAFGSADLSMPGSNYVALLEKAYGQYLAITMERSLRPALPVEAAWSAHSAQKAQLGLRLLTGKTPRLLTTPPLNQRVQWKDTVAAALRQCRGENKRVYVVHLTGGSLDLLDARAPVVHANQIRHGMITFNGSATELTYFDPLGRLTTTAIGFEQLFSQSLAFYAVLD